MRRLDAAMSDTGKAQGHRADLDKIVKTKNLHLSGNADVYKTVCKGCGIAIYVTMDSGTVLYTTIGSMLPYGSDAVTLCPKFKALK